MMPLPTTPHATDKELLHTRQACVAAFCYETAKFTVFVLRIHSRSSLQATRYSSDLYTYSRA